MAARSRLFRYGFWVFLVSWIILLLRYFDIGVSNIMTHAPGECDFVKGITGGSDDTAISPYGIFVSGGFNTPKLYLVNGLHAVTCKIRGAPYRFAPLGISFFENDEHSLLFVVNGWTDGWGRSSSVEIFDVADEGRSLTHKRSITDASFNYVSDIYAVSHDSFWFSNAFGTGWPLYYFEFFTRYGGGSVGFHTGKNSSIVAKQMPFANGLAMHHEFLYVASTGHKSIYAYKLTEKKIEKLGEIDVHCGVDKLNIDPIKGDMWIACQPVMYQLAARWLFGSGNLASKVLRIQVPSKGFPTPGSVTEVYSNAGSRHDHTDGASTAIRNGTDLWIGAVGGRLLHCNMEKKKEKKEDEDE